MFMKDIKEKVSFVAFEEVVVGKTLVMTIEPKYDAIRIERVGVAISGSEIDDLRHVFMHGRIELLVMDRLIGSPIPIGTVFDTQQQSDSWSDAAACEEAWKQIASDDEERNEIAHVASIPCVPFAVPPRAALLVNVTGLAEGVIDPAQCQLAVFLTGTRTRSLI